MAKIKQLPEHIIAQIAAGEVIERPVYAVKELVENAIDANADTIQIFLENAGLKKIMVIDNGDGMSKEDAIVSYRHHTTSKISAKTNLHAIKSLGFRGEALSSIAAVSTMTIKTKSAEDPAGTQLIIQSGNLVKQTSTGLPQGTNIQVEQLFSTLPARKKFLKSERTELRQITDSVLQIALAYPHIRFQLVHNNKLIIDLPKTKSIIERVKLLLGTDIFAELIPVQYETPYMAVTGFISKPNLASTNSNKQYLFVNNRNISDTTIAQAVKEGYNSLLDSTSYPIFILFLTIPHEMVDVNIHPRKEQVAFVNAQELKDAVKTSIIQTLQKHNITPHDIGWNTMPSFAANMLKDEVLPWDIANIARIIESSDVIQVHNVYLITQTYNGILIVDQHAAHERVLYEQFLTAYHKKNDRKKILELSEALSIQISPFDIGVIEENIDTLKDLGFQVKQFGNNMVQLTHIPAFYQSHDIRSLFTEMLNDLAKDKIRSVDTQSQKMIAYLACRSAWKAGDKLTKKQSKELIELLEKSPNNYTCPHGRPTKIELSLNHIHKLFKRK